VNEHGKRSTASVLALGQSKVEEALANVRLHRALAQMKTAGDAGVREASGLVGFTDRGRYPPP
jgi:hypothetical protein